MRTRLEHAGSPASVLAGRTAPSRRNLDPVMWRCTWSQAAADSRGREPVFGEAG